MRFFNYELDQKDFVAGVIYGLFSVFGAGFFGFVVAMVTGFLWAMGGAGVWGTNFWRRYLCPLVMGAVFSIAGFNPHFCAVSAALQIVAMHIGYSMPSMQPPDRGSFLGRFYDAVGDQVGWNDTAKSEATRLTWTMILFFSMVLMFHK